MMQPYQQPIIHFGPTVPVMSYDKFAEHVGMSKRWVQEQIEQGNIPIMPKKGKATPMINVALYWQIALSQTY